MKKRGFIFICVGVGVFLICHAALAADGNKAAVTQGDLAKALAERMDLAVSEEAPGGDYFSTLEKRGIRPADGWENDRPVTKQDLEKVFVEAGRLQSEVLSGKEPKAVLKERGIILPERIDEKSLNNTLDDQNVKRLLQAPVISGLSIPYPTQEVTLSKEVRILDAEGNIPIEEFPEPVKVEAPPITQTTEEPATVFIPPEPPATERVYPSGGGGQ